MAELSLSEAIIAALVQANGKPLTIAQLHRERQRMAGQEPEIGGSGATLTCASRLANQYAQVEFIPGPPKSFRWVGRLADASNSSGT